MNIEEAIQEVMDCVDPIFQRINPQSQKTIMNLSWGQTDIVFEDFYSLHDYSFDHFGNFLTNYDSFNIISHLFERQYLIRALIELNSLPFHSLTGRFSSTFVLNHYFTQLQNQGRTIPFQHPSELNFLKFYLVHSGLAN